MEHVTVQDARVSALGLGTWFELTERERDRIARPSVAKSSALFLRNEMGI